MKTSLLVAWKQFTQELDTHNSDLRRHGYSPVAYAIPTLSTFMFWIENGYIKRIEPFEYD